MKNKLALCLLLSLSATSLVHLGVVAAGGYYTPAAPSQAYFLLANEIADLFQQLEKLPTAQATSLLRQKAPTLQARIKYVRPAYQKYLKSLSPNALQAENKRVAMSQWGTYFAKLEEGGLAASPRLKTLLKPGSPSGQVLLDLMGIFDKI